MGRCWVEQDFLVYPRGGDWEILAQRAIPGQKSKEVHGLNNDCQATYWIHRLREVDFNSY